MLYPECPNCGPMYYDISYNDSRIEDGILIVICECHDIDCDYKVERIFTAEWCKKDQS